MAETFKPTTNELENIIRKSVKDALSEFEKEKIISNTDKLLTISQVSKKLGKSFRTIKKWVDAGILQTTKNGLVTEASLNEYLKG
ncbi:MAG: helix-turn-helix domain-containing protein [Bacteroidota bacterium]